MANKQYISIVRLFHHCGIATDEALNLPRVKKQMQAEFSVAQGGFIDVDGHTYSRHDVFEEIERPDFLRRFEFHKQIWASPQLLDLLEENKIQFAAIAPAFKPFWSNKEFDEFFSPYFVGPFSYLSRTYLTEMRLEDMGNLLAYEDFLLPDEREEAFRPIRVFLDENLRTLRNVNKDNYKLMRPKFNHWIDADWYLFFNNLPHEFYEVKNDIITYIINIGVAVQKSHRSDCKKMSEQLISLQDTPESLRSIIVSNHAVYTGQSTSSGGGWKNILWIIWVVIMIARAVGSDGCGSSSKPNFEYLPSDYNIKYTADSAVYKLLDSIRLKSEGKTMPVRIIPSTDRAIKTDTSNHNY